MFFHFLGFPAKKITIACFWAI